MLHSFHFCSQEIKSVPSHKAIRLSFREEWFPQSVVSKSRRGTKCWLGNANIVYHSVLRSSKKKS